LKPDHGLAYLDTSNFTLETASDTCHCEPSAAISRFAQIPHSGLRTVNWELTTDIHPRRSQRGLRPQPKPVLAQRRRGAEGRTRRVGLAPPVRRVSVRSTAFRRVDNSGRLPRSASLARNDIGRPSMSLRGASATKQPPPCSLRTCEMRYYRRFQPKNSDRQSTGTPVLRGPFSGPPDQTANTYMYGGLIDPERPKTAFSRAPVRIIRPPNALRRPVWRSDPGGLNFWPQNATGPDRVRSGVVRRYPDGPRQAASVKFQV